MKKKISITILSMIFLLFFTTPIFADSNVVFDGNSKEFVFLPSDLFIDLKDIMPGEIRREKIILKNTSDDKLDFYLKVENHKNVKDGLEDLRDELISLLEFNVSFGENKVITKSLKDVIVGTKEKNGYTYIATLDKNESVDIGVEIYAPGDLIGNKFQGLDLYVDWHFYVEENEASIDGSGDTGNNGGNGSGDGNGTLPTTGENIIYIFSLIITSLGAIILLANKKKE